MCFNLAQKSHQAKRITRTETCNDKKLQLKISKPKFSRNLESLKFKKCNDIKLQLPNLEIKIASINTSALSMQIFHDVK